MVSRQRASRWFQYLYFLRFSLLAWFFLILLCLLDLGDVTSTFTRGIMTLDSGWQVFHAAFFVVALHMTVLITARNTVRNGKSRFRSSVPPRLCVALTSSSAKAVWTVLAIAHIPTCLTLAYLGYTAYKEEEQYTLPLFGTHSWNIWFFFLFGIAAAFFFWYVVSLFYHWTYRSSPKSPAALVFPEEIFGDTAVVIPPPRLICWIDRLTRFVLKNFTFPGYAETPTGPLWELHFFSSISLLGIFLLYLFLYPITAPILRPAATRVGVLMALLTTILFEIGIYNASTVTADPTVKSRWAPYVKRIFQAIPAVFFLLFVYAVGYDISHKAVRLEMAFPTLASILVIANFFLWLFAGASFFFDRYRIPVLTAVLLLIFVPKVTAPYLAGLLVRLHLPWLAQSLDLEHYYTVHNLDAPATPPIPSDVLALRAADLTEPYIVVTASGGGIQAAEWTSQVMASLERRFADAHLQSSGRTPYTFHDHLLLASGVSGGSLGLMPYLLEYTAANPAMPFPSNDGITNRITNPSACSSLEAVAWGLAYYDLYRLLFTFRLPLPEVLTPDTAPDRTWALTAAFNRNLHDRHCGTDPDSLKGLPTISDGDGMTLASSADMLRKGRLPSFAFNTTAAETGGRFLLSNYWVPSDPRPHTDFIPAESFLQAYAQDNPTSSRSTSRTFPSPPPHASLPPSLTSLLAPASRPNTLSTPTTSSMAATTTTMAPLPSSSSSSPPSALRREQPKTWLRSSRFFSSRSATTTVPVWSPTRTISPVRTVAYSRSLLSLGRLSISSTVRCSAYGTLAMKVSPVVIAESSVYSKPPTKGVSQSTTSCSQSQRRKTRFLAKLGPDHTPAKLNQQVGQRGSDATNHRPVHCLGQPRSPQPGIPRTRTR
jgi:hypothetical protein